MRDYSIKVEHTRLDESNQEMEFPPFKERHRVFPKIFEDRNHKKILDSSAGLGYSAKRIKDNYSSSLICNELAPMCHPALKELNVPVLCFDLDDGNGAYPFTDGSFDAVVSLVTIEHLLDVDHFLAEINRILSDGGYLYLATPNYACPEYLYNPVIKGKSYHDPLSESDKYEFYGHVRYFTYNTLVEFVPQFGFSLDTVYIAKPEGSDRYLELYNRSKMKARLLGSLMTLRHKILGPRFAPEPILCFKKSDLSQDNKIRKVIL